MTQETTSTSAEDVFDVGDSIEDVDLDALEEKASTGGGKILPVTFDMGYVSFRRGVSPAERFHSAMKIGQKAAEQEVRDDHAAGEKDNPPTYERRGRKKERVTAQLCLKFDGNRILNDDPKPHWGGDTGIRYETLPMYPEYPRDVKKEDYVRRAYQQVKVDAIVPIVENTLGFDGDNFGFEKQSHVFGREYWVRVAFIHDPYVVNEILRYLRGYDGNIWAGYSKWGDMVLDYCEDNGEPLDIDDPDLESTVVTILREATEEDERGFGYWIPKILEVYENQAAARAAAGDDLNDSVVDFEIPEGWDESASGPFQQIFTIIVDAVRDEDIEMINSLAEELVKATGKEETDKVLAQAQTVVASEVEEAEEDELPW